MLNLEEIVEKLKDRKLTVVAAKSGLAYDTVWRVSCGRIKSVSYDVIKKLSDYLIDVK